MNKRLAVIMAGGSGERFWPVSTRERPKQFLKLSRPDRTLLEDSIERARRFAEPADIYISTGRHLEDLSAKTCDRIPTKNILAEPTKRNTAGALAWVAANVIAQHRESWESTTLAILTADQRIHPEDGFARTVAKAMDAAEQEGAIVTIGIRPDRPETGFGYIEVGEPVDKVKRVIQFREKPDLETAEEFLMAGNFLWNSGMFFYTLPTFMSELETASPDIASAIYRMADLLETGEIAAADSEFERLPSISIDFALMEKARHVLVAEAEFEWDDLGAWDSVSRSYESDESLNVALGRARSIDSRDNVVYNETETHEVCLLGVEGLAVVVTDGTVLVIPKSRAQEVKRFLQS